MHPENHSFISFLTKVRPDLEIVFEYPEVPAVLWWDIDKTPLSKVPPQPSQAPDPNENDNRDTDDEVRARRRANAEEFRRAGRMHALGSALGRPPYGFEEDVGIEDELSSDEDGMNDASLQRMMLLMAELDDIKALDELGGLWYDDHGGFILIQWRHVARCSFDMH